MKPEIPPELLEMARHPALPGTPAAVVVGRDNLTGKAHVNVIAPQGGHALLDLYFCAIASGYLRDWPMTPGLTVAETELDLCTALAWRLAISALRTRPDTGPVPSRLPEAGL